MVILRYPLPWLAFALVLTAAGSGRAEELAQCGGKPFHARIATALDGVSLKLADGRTMRLVHLIAPLPIDGDQDAPLRAKEALAKLADGKDATIYLHSDATDRYGRISVKAVSIEGKTWLEAALLAEGSARVNPSQHDKCVKALLRFEAKARAERKGIWNEEKFTVFDAQNVAGLLAAEGRFAIVEGAISHVGDRRGRLYLDFGRRFTEDFTIIVPDRVRKSLTAQGSDPKDWRGKRVRVRGILLSWGGPAVEVSLAQAIELLD